MFSLEYQSGLNCDIIRLSTDGVSSRIVNPTEEDFYYGRTTITAIIQLYDRR